MNKINKNFSFQENKEIQKAFSYSNIPKITGLVMKWSGGKIKEQKTADNVLLGFSFTAVFVSFILIYSIGQGPNIPLPPGTTVIYPLNEPPRLTRLLV